MFIMKPVLDKFGIRLDRAFSCEDAFFCFEDDDQPEFWMFLFNFKIHLF
jgi:hypothetical protein